MPELAVKIYRAPVEDNYRFKADFTIREGETLEPGNWFGWGNRAELKEGMGWVTRELIPDSYAKSKPKIAAQDNYEVTIEGHDGHHWMRLIPNGDDWRVKLSLGEQLTAGRYMARICTRKSKYGDGEFLSGHLEPYRESKFPHPVTEEVRQLAQVAADTMVAPVDVGTEQVQPSVEAMRAELKRLQAKVTMAEVDAAFPDPAPKETEQPVPTQGELPI